MAARTIAGARVTSASAPTAAGLPVACRISHPLATICSQLPAFDATLASQTSRNARTRSTSGTKRITGVSRGRRRPAAARADQGRWMVTRDPARETAISASPPCVAPDVTIRTAVGLANRRRV